MKSAPFILGIASLAWFVIELVIQSFLVRPVKRERIDNGALLRVSWLTIVTGCVFGLLSIRFSFSLFYLECFPVSLAGVVCIAFGAFIRYRAVFSMKKFFTVNLRVHREQALMTSGIYTHIRHPSYLGLMVSVFGLSIAYVNWLSFILIFPMISAWLMKRISLEELMLEEHFGDEYRAYRKRTKKLVPFIY